MYGTIIQFILLMLAHAAAGIYSSTLKYSKKFTYIIWGAWATLQSALMVISEFVLTGVVLQFFIGFVLTLIGQYAIFFITTKGKLVQRIFTILTYSVFFCIFMAFDTVIRGSFPSMHVILKIIVHISLMAGILFYFLKCVCPLCQAASKSVVTGWHPLVFVNFVFLIYFYNKYFFYYQWNQYQKKVKIC